MSKRFWRLFLVLLLPFVASTLPANAQVYPGPTVPVQGSLIARNTSTPAPGLTVFLIHPVLGRSAPSFSDVYGRFGWMAIPVRPEPYYVEVYWGKNLIYRQAVRINGPLAMPPIFL